MNTLESLYFPGTQIFSGSQFPLFLLFKPLHILSPVEPADDEEKDDNSSDIFNSSGFCQAHTPCPLGENRDRFLHLVRDIKNRKDDYAAQLSSLTVASMSAPPSRGDDSRQSIVSSLMGTQHVNSDSDEERETLLWQARLVLKIGEILDHEEEEVAMQLALLDDRETELFKRLQGEVTDEEESLFEELQQLKQNINRPSPGAIRNRFNGWKQLFLAGKFPDLRIWTTQMVEVADMLLEQYEELASEKPPVVMELELPANIGWDGEEVLELAQTFRHDNSVLYSKLLDTLSNPDQPSATGPAIAQEWRTALDSAFPQDRFGRTTLTLYLMAKHPCTELLGKAGQQTDSGTILAVLREQS